MELRGGGSGALLGRTGDYGGRVIESGPTNQMTVSGGARSF